MDNCAAPGLLPLAEALNQQLAMIQCHGGITEVPLENALARILADDITAQHNVPPEDNSAMDGYALSLSEKHQGNEFRLIGEALAGHPFKDTVQPGEAIRIMTGAPVPSGADCVVMKENCRESNNQVSVTGSLAPGQNIRPAGSDIQQGQKLISKGTRLTAPQLAMLASLGIPSVRVYQKLKIGIIATGDELQPPGQELAAGQLYESNRYGLRAMLTKLPVDVVDYGILPDDPERIKSAFLQAAEECDWLLSSGGVSVGDADYVKQVLEDVGDIGFWKVAIKPGKPYAFGRISKCWFSGLPGNPVSAFVTFLHLVVPGIRKLTGQTPAEPVRWRATLAAPVHHRPGRLDFQRGKFKQEPDGTFSATPCAKQSSGVMTSFLQANCFILIPANAEHPQAGTQVDIIPFDGFLN